MGVNSTDKEWFKYFPFRSYCTKSDSKNTFDRYCKYQANNFGFQVIIAFVLDI